ncbi:MAG: effector binding domain-containing protein [Myxococcales bacterium]|nr:effector binding domain-containing protein [Myxococcales bacterium]MCB9648443.1 effector binding domain-containing protein [Deltaproteobacteria bacterium]
MKPTDHHQDTPIRVLGYASWIDKARASQQIGALWGQASQAGLLHPDRPAFGVYFDYQDRLADRYRVLVGVESDATPVDGQETITIPAGRYARLTGEGRAAEVASTLWREVWTDGALGAQRSFGVDFERYVGGPEDSRVELMISSSSPAPRSAP